jgi:hypothetical protein
LAKLLNRVIDRQQSIVGHGHFELVRVDLGPMTVAFAPRRFSPPRVIDQYATHRFRCRGKEVTPILKGWTRSAK